MNEGYLFYFILWMCCFFLYFFSNESLPIRKKKMIWLFVTIIFSGYTIRIYGLSVNMAWLVAAIWASWQWITWENKIILWGSAAIFSVAIGVFCLHIFAVLHPIFFIVNVRYMITILMIVVSLVIYQKTVEWLSFNIVGLFSGEIAFSLFISAKGLNHPGLLYDSLDILAFCMMSGVVWKVIENILYHQMPIKSRFGQSTKGKTMRR